jgi:hypothetical protein
VLVLATATDDPAQVAAAQFALGFTCLWCGEWDAAEPPLTASLAFAERVGDVFGQTQCLTYLSVLARLRGQVGAARQFAERGLACAQDCASLLYEGATRANLAWAVWRSGQRAHARAGLLEALKLLTPQYPFHWLALWPLIAMHVPRDETIQAISLARQLLSPPQQRLPVALSSALEAAIRAWDSNQPGAARSSLKRAIQSAKALGQL